MRIHCTYRAGSLPGYHQRRTRFRYHEDTVVAERALGQWHGRAWRSPVHMLRWSSRLTLRIVDVHAARLRDAERDGCVFDRGDLPDDAWVWVIAVEAE